MEERELYNLAIEKGILSAFFFEPGYFDEASTQISADDFYLPAHSHIFEAMSVLHAQDKPIDEEFVRDWLLSEKRYNEAVLLDVLATTPLSHPAYIEKLRELSTRRRLVELGFEIRKAAIDEQEIDEIVNTVEQKLFAITQNKGDKDFKDAREVVHETLEYIKKMKERGGTHLVGHDTGFRELNMKTAGLNAGELVIIAARPSMGKTAFALNIASKLLDHGIGVAFFSLEMPADQLLLRMLSAKTSIPLQDLRLGNLDDMQWKSLTQAMGHFERSKLFVDDESLLTIGKLRSKLRKLKMHHPDLGACFIDYLQLMSGSSGKDRHLEVSEISRGLKLLAKDLGIPIIALSQLNRSLESRTDRRPMLSDLRESGAIEQDADIILFVYRDDVYKMKDEQERRKKEEAEGKVKGPSQHPAYIDKPEEEAEIIIGKNRNGPIGVVKLMFQKRFTRFVNASEIPVEIHYEETKIDMGSFPKF